MRGGSRGSATRCRLPTGSARIDIQVGIARPLVGIAHADDHGLQPSPAPSFFVAADIHFTASTRLRRAAMTWVAIACTRAFCAAGK